MWASVVDRRLPWERVHSFLRGSIQDGGFTLTCPSSLPSQMTPWAAVIIDVDASGGCSPGDLYDRHWLFGWEDDAELVFAWVAEDASLVEHADEIDGETICEFFVPEGGL